MQNSLQVFDYEGSNVRTVILDDEVWFVAKDVCDILGLDNVTQAISTLDDDEKMTLSQNEGHSGKRGGAQSLNVVSEPGLYALIFKSQKPEAKAFARWVRHELLPQVMHTGSYIRMNAESINVIAAKQSTLRISKKLWLSLFSAISDTEKLLNLPTPSGVCFSLPEHAEEDHSELLFLRSILTSARELTQNKLRAIDQRQDMLNQLMKY